MFNKKMLFIISLLAVAAVAAIAFFAGKVELPTGKAPSKELDVTDDAYPIYKKAEDLLSGGQAEKAKNTFLVIAEQYPDSDLAGEALKNASSIYMEQGDQKRALEYYTKLKDDYPWVEGTDDLRARIEEKNMEDLMSPAIGEGSEQYTVQAGDSLYRISRKFDTTIELIKKVNGLQGDVIRVGQRLKVIDAEFSIVVDKEQNILVLKKDGEFFKTYDVATGKNNSTPVGTFKVEEKLVKPLWYSVGAVVSPESEEYELGSRWMGISAPGYGIHGTKEEDTIGQQVSLGCIRMRDNDVIELFDIVPSGTEVVIVDSLKEGAKPAVAESDFTTAPAPAEAG